VTTASTQHSRDLDPLRQAHRGPVLGPEDDGYDAARVPWNVAVDQRPAAVALPESADDVQAAVRFAAENGLGVRVQGTGHGAAGDLEGVLLIDTSRLDEISVDPDRRVARIGAGAQWKPIAAAAAEHGLAVLSGSAPDVGAVGYTLGGGLGWLARRFGLSCNSVEAVELVTADGALRRLEADQGDDLFWAIRGGGGSFGAVVALELRLHPVAEVYAGNLFWPITEAPAVLEAYRRLAAEAPEELTTSFRLLRLPPIPLVPEPLRGKAWVNVLGAFTGPSEEGAALLAPLRATAPPAMDTFGPLSPGLLGTIAGEPEEPIPAFYTHELLAGLPADAAAALLEVAGPDAESPLLQVELRHLGGAVGRSEPDNGACPAFDAEFALFALGVPMGPVEPAALTEHLALLVEALEPWSTGRRMFNFSAPDAESASLFDPDTYARLTRIRREVDPDGLFRANHPISVG
jgi:FAD/FMN-containing dehydrogenase